MSDEKDPVREQIERDAEAAFHELGFVGSETRARIHGMQHQDPIAWNRCLDAVIKEIDNESDYLMMSWKSKSAEALQKFKDKLENMRR